jgi:hypothetical protein
MSGSRWDQFADWAIVIGAAGLTGSALFSPGKVLLAPAANDVTHPAIRESAFWCVFLWCAVWPAALFARSGFLSDTNSVVIRFAWAFGCVLLLWHIAIAFHVGHGWSHQAAWDHTRQVGGYGDGIYVNYFFALVWFADAVWMCAAFSSYLARPLWLHYTIHGFLAFIVFNAAVVFGSSDSRAAFFGVPLLALTAGLLVRFLTTKATSNRPSPQ